MNPSDGTFDTQTEGATVDVDTTGWMDGIYNLYVYGWDIAPNYNTTSTAYGTIVVDEPPVILSTNPADTATGIPVNQPIIITFNESIDTTTWAFTCSPDPGGWSVIWSNGNQTATYSHNDFTGETAYTFNITGAKDLAGNDLIAGPVPKSIFCMLAL